MKVQYFLICIVVIGFSFRGFVELNAKENPFLRPGSNPPQKPLIQKTAPPPPPPIPNNPNLEFRGYFKLDSQWFFALFDKSKNRGEWLKKGQKMAEGLHVIESFNPETEVIKLKGGMTISLKDSEKRTLPLPSGLSNKPPPKRSNPGPRSGIPPPNRKK